MPPVQTKEKLVFTLPPLTNLPTSPNSNLYLILEAVRDQGLESSDPQAFFYQQKITALFTHFKNIFGDTFPTLPQDFSSENILHFFEAALNAVSHLPEQNISPKSTTPDKFTLDQLLINLEEHEAQKTISPSLKSRLDRLRSRQPSLSSEVLEETAQTISKRSLAAQKKITQTLLAKNQKIPLPEAQKLAQTLVETHLKTPLPLKNLRKETKKLIRQTQKSQLPDQKTSPAASRALSKSPLIAQELEAASVSYQIKEATTLLLGHTVIELQQAGHSLNPSQQAALSSRLKIGAASSLLSGGNFLRQFQRSIEKSLSAPDTKAMAEGYAKATAEAAKLNPQTTKDLNAKLEKTLSQIQETSSTRQQDFAETLKTKTASSQIESDIAQTLANTGNSPAQARKTAHQVVFNTKTESALSPFSPQTAATIAQKVTDQSRHPDLTALITDQTQAQDLLASPHIRQEIFKIKLTEELTQLNPSSAAPLITQAVDHLSQTLSPLSQPQAITEAIRATPLPSVSEGITETDLNLAKLRLETFMANINDRPGLKERYKQIRSLLDQGLKINQETTLHLNSIQDTLASYEKNAALLRLWDLSHGLGQKLFGNRLANWGKQKLLKTAAGQAVKQFGQKIVTELGKKAIFQLAKNLAIKGALTAALSALGTTIGGPLGTLIGLAIGFTLDTGFWLFKKVKDLFGKTLGALGINIPQNKLKKAGLALGGLALTGLGAGAAALGAGLTALTTVSLAIPVASIVIGVFLLIIILAFLWQGTLASVVNIATSEVGDTALYEQVAFNDFDCQDGLNYDSDNPSSALACNVLNSLKACGTNLNSGNSLSFRACLTRLGTLEPQTINILVESADTYGELQCVGFKKAIQPLMAGLYGNAADYYQGNGDYQPINDLLINDQNLKDFTLARPGWDLVWGPRTGCNGQTCSQNSACCGHIAMITKVEKNETGLSYVYISHGGAGGFRLTKIPANDPYLQAASVLCNPAQADCTLP